MCLRSSQRGELLAKELEPTSVTLATATTGPSSNAQLPTAAHMSSEKMTEGEVGIRLALHLIKQGWATKDVQVAIDGAQVQTGQTVHFPIAEFLKRSGCTANEADSWQGRYAVAGSKIGITIHSSPGLGDVVAELKSGKRLVAECKRGSTTPSKSSAEYPRIREAIGQLMTNTHERAEDVLAVAVPHSERTERLTNAWREAPRVKNAGIQLVTVDRDGGVHGLTLE